MKGLFRGMGSGAGKAPGTLVESDLTRQHLATTIELVQLSPGLLERRPIEPEALSVELRTDRISWIRLIGFRDLAAIESLGASAGIDALLLEDCVNPYQRSRFEEGDGFVFATLKGLWFEAAGPGSTSLIRGHVAIYLSDRFIVSFEEEPVPALESVVSRLSEGRFRERVDSRGFLAYLLADALVDGCFVALEKLSDSLEEMEVRLMDHPGPEELSAMHRLRTDSLLFRKAVWPMREALSDFQRCDSRLLGDSCRRHLRDVYDHALQVADTVETLRDIVSGMLDTYLSSVSNRMNQVMKVLTIIATIFIPLTFLAGIYGMNFHHMPELGQRWAYPAVLGLMAVTALCMLCYFRRRKWI
ncbi:magnesium/cobalt transporter CorA [Candidatus Fermentibacterales bacterium]|nr:magnesium/cobalt transporter CorA [Candidatus Fermentibacterales bacterium]